MRNIKLQILEMLRKEQFSTASLNDLRDEFGNSLKVNATLMKLKKLGLIEPAEIPLIQTSSGSVSIDAYKLTDKGKLHVKMRSIGITDFLMNPWTITIFGGLVVLVIGAKIFHIGT